MSIEIIQSQTYGERLAIMEEPNSGLHIQVIPIRGERAFKRSYASLSVFFGSNDTHFTGSDGRKIIIPDGSAHFLEHKMFENKTESALNAFSRLGARSNAGTGFEHTRYYFATTDNFAECLTLLLGFVFNPYITPENVEKEKGIIAEEIRMYDDDPYSICGQNLMKALYKVHPVRNDISGTEQDIMQITSETLMTAYDAFYRPENMLLTVVGDVDPRKVLEIVSKAGIKRKQGALGVTDIPNEPSDIASKLVTNVSEVAMPQFSIGAKFIPKAGEDMGLHKLQRDILGQTALALLFDPTTKWYETLYNNGTINSNFFVNYAVYNTFEYTEIGGETEDPTKLLEIIQKRIDEVHNEGMDGEHFTKIKRALRGQNMGGFSSPITLGGLACSVAEMGHNVFEYLDLYGKMRIEDVQKFIDDVLYSKKDQLACSIVSRAKETK